MIQGPLIDRFGRIHMNLRLSVTDRCNIRCFYCMPAEVVQFRPRTEILTFEEITRFVRVAAQLGVNKLRITGGEPLVRSELAKLISALSAVDGIRDIALTTNGVLLAEQARDLAEAGLRRLNVSLDTLDRERFTELTRRDMLDRVLEGIDEAKRVGFEKIKLNAIAIRDVTEREVLSLAQFARQHALELRFIEYMPLDADQTWQSQQVLSGEEIRAQLEEPFGPLEPVLPEDPSQPATDFRYHDMNLRVGFINPVTQPFCHECNRLRLTAEGKVRNCLFSTTEWDAREVLRGGMRDEQLADLISDCVAAKRRAHGIDTEDFVRPDRAMYQIGG